MKSYSLWFKSCNATQGERQKDIYQFNQYSRRENIKPLKKYASSYSSIILIELDNSDISLSVKTQDWRSVWISRRR
ncbi:hypothetical protein OUZ56_001482 [Daphnia magna]|uniref:Uncharacterized protein n=1 Tax=Daphnia magna TaxID=35525 RepID=A0ABR0A2S1_9CRUS|nr:hypothetical protein OUZ56_001482 [Daphnia magna]